MSCGAALVQFVGPATARKAIAQEHRQRRDRRSIERVPSPFLPLPNHHGVGNPSFPGSPSAWLAARLRVLAGLFEFLSSEVELPPSPDPMTVLSWWPAKVFR